MAVTSSSTLTTFDVSWVLETLASDEGVSLDAGDIDDVCYGMVISSDATLSQVLRQHAGVYNYLIVDGDPIRLRRRIVNDGLVIDFEINEVDCIRRGQAPALSFSRVEPSTLPREVEIQYMDPDRDYATATQAARHSAAPTTNTKISISINFVISSTQAREMAFDLLYRIWSQQLSLVFEHPDMSIEPGDTVQVTSTAGQVYTILVTQQTINMPTRSNLINGTILLTQKGIDIAAGTYDPFVTNTSDDWASWIAAL